MKSLLAAFLLLTLFDLGEADDGKHSSCSSPLGDPGRVSETAFSASSPRFNAEEAYSTHMPEHLLCDACKAIAFQMQEYLAKAEAKRSSAKAPATLLSESEYVDTLENSCSQSWENYGVTEVQGVKRFTGPGLRSQETMTVMMTGGPWPARLYMLCQSYLGEFGEEQIYEEYRRQPAALAVFLCSGEQKACTRLGDTKGRNVNKMKAMQSEL
uniref:Marginal zone B and B1 cell specific protein n=1 Tax=Pelusios castaneus TaxID=367368 RepID=A0A8C8SQE2_9SAUR